MTFCLALLNAASLAVAGGLWLRDALWVRRLERRRRHATQGSLDALEAALAAGRVREGTAWWETRYGMASGWEERVVAVVVTLMDGQDLFLADPSARVSASLREAGIPVADDPWVRVVEHGRPALAWLAFIASGLALVALGGV